MAFRNLFLYWAYLVFGAVVYGLNLFHFITFNVVCTCDLSIGIYIYSNIFSFSLSIHLENLIITVPCLVVPDSRSEKLISVIKFHHKP